MVVARNAIRPKPERLRSDKVPGRVVLLLTKRLNLLLQMSFLFAAGTCSSLRVPGAFQW